MIDKLAVAEFSEKSKEICSTIAGFADKYPNVYVAEGYDLATLNQSTVDEIKTTLDESGATYIELMLLLDVVRNIKFRRTVKAAA